MLRATSGHGTTKECDRGFVSAVTESLGWLSCAASPARLALTRALVLKAPRALPGLPRHSPYIRRRLQRKPR